MKRKIGMWLGTGVCLLAAGCQPAERPSTQSPEVSEASADKATKNDPRQVALEARDALFKKLSTRLVEAMSNGGPAAAIEVCSKEAPRLAAAVGKEHGVAIGRTSFKLRNPKNAPPDWAKPLVEERKKEAEFIDLPGGETGALLPIKLKVQCLTCHGPADQIAEDVKTKLNELYPEDQATGFQEGDLRGWFWVVVSDGETPSEG